jgi:hypothetical protein
MTLTLLYVKKPQNNVKVFEKSAEKKFFPKILSLHNSYQKNKKDKERL